MMKIKITIFCFFLFFCALTISLFGTAFVKPKGNGAIDLQYLYFKSDHFWNEHGRCCQSYNLYERRALLARAEYGLTTRCTVAATTSYNLIHETMNGCTRGFEDVNLSLKYFLGNYKRKVISIEGKVIIPVDHQKCDLRYGCWGGQGSILVSQLFTFKQRCGWWDAKLGYRGYCGYPSNQIHAKGALGLSINSRLTLVGTGKLELGLSRRTKGPQNITRCHSNCTLFKLQGEAFVRVWKQSYLTFGGFWHAWGCNVGTGGGIFGGGRFNF